MIKTLRLRNFKAFEDTGDVELKPITVVAGPNRGGKSSILQSLLLLKQTLEAPPEIDLSLDGKFLQFSGFSDLVFSKPPLADCNLSFEFGLETRMPQRVIPRYFPDLELSEESEEGVTLHTQGLFILSSFPRRRESMWSCHEKIAIGHGHVGSPFLGKDETHLTQFGK